MTNSSLTERLKRLEEDVDAQFRARKLDEQKELYLDGSGLSKKTESSQGVHDERLGELEHQLCDLGRLRRARLEATDKVGRELMRELCVVSAIKKLAPVPHDFKERCASLLDKFPQFERAINDFIMPELALTKLSGRGLKFPHLCLQGDPGVGKTYFAETFAKTFELPFARINLEGTQGAFTISGLDRSYSNHQPGRILRFLAAESTQVANGLIAFEEIDKAKGDERYALENVFLQLLEEGTAKEFVDQSIPDVAIDIRPLNFIFTANKLGNISAPLLSRLTVIELDPLTKEQAVQIGRSQFEKLIKELSLEEVGLKLDNESSNALGGYSPREQKIILRTALGKSIIAEQTTVQIPAKKSGTSRRLGFY